MKLLIFTALGGALLLSGCAGTQSEFECNATTSDTCMTMQQANDKAKLKEEGDAVKPGAGVLPRLAEGRFLTTSPSYPLPAPVLQTASRSPRPSVPTPSARPFSPVTPPTSDTFRAGDYPRPLRVGEQIAQLWIAPYIDTADVYHQPSSVVFVVTPSRWGKPRIH